VNEERSVNTWSAQFRLSIARPLFFARSANPEKDFDKQQLIFQTTPTSLHTSLEEHPYQLKWYHQLNINTHSKT
jgi:hypothetical protein